MNVVIIEDEKLTAKDLAKTLKAIDGDIDIAATLSSVEEAMNYFKTKPAVDLIFSDIELGDGLSFDIYTKLKITTPIIFCTAYNQYALDAFKTAGIDYLLKPFSKLTVAKALEKFYNLKEKLSEPGNDYSTLMQVLKAQLASAKTPSVIIQQGKKIIPLDGAAIALFYIENDYVFAYTFEGKSHILSQKLDALEKNFSPAFFRANRQFLVNRKAVKDASHHFNRKIVINLVLPFKEQIIIGKLKTAAFVNWLANS